MTTPETREQINEVLKALRADREKSRRMLSDGSYVRDKGGEGTSSQEALYRYFSNYKVSLEEKKPAERVSPPPEKQSESAQSVSFLQRLKEFFS